MKMQTSFFINGKTNRECYLYHNLLFIFYLEDAKKEILVRQSIAKEDALKKFGERGETYKCELISELEGRALCMSLSIRRMPRTLLVPSLPLHHQPLSHKREK